MIVATLALAAYVAVASPVEDPLRSEEVGLKVPTGVLALFFLLALAFVAGARLVARAVHERRLAGFRPRPDARGVLIVGAGDGGRLVLREVMRNPTLKLSPLGFLDDDPRLRGVRVEGVKVLGDTERDLSADPRRRRARRGHHRDPVGAGHSSRARRARVS